MFTKIVVPVDLEHEDKLRKALDVAADLAKHYGIEAVYVGVTTEQPSALAHTPAEYGQKLKKFADDEGATHGHATAAKAYASHDPAVDLNDILVKAIEEIGADLVVIAAYVPTLADHLRRSHEGAVAARSKRSVLIVR